MITLKEFIAKTYWSCKVAVILANDPRRKGDMTLKEAKERSLFYGVADDLHMGIDSCEFCNAEVTDCRLIIEIKYDL